MIVIQAIEKLLSLFLLNDFNTGNTLTLDFFTINNTTFNIQIPIIALSILTITIITIVMLYYLIDFIIIFIKRLVK